MPDDTPTQDNPETRPNHTGRRRRRRFLIFGGLSLAALASLFTARSWAHGPRGFFGGFHHRKHPRTARELRAHLGERADHILGRLDATDAQREEVGAILDRIAPQMHALHMRGRELHEHAAGALDGGDRDALERSRQRAVALFDEGSALAVQATQELYAVLDEEQRAEVRDHLHHLRGHHHGMH
ncbi:MAG: Spy/CpxP family protein refolding chaperone [Myxococcales bacterium]|jgi:Spy/CpxP family protein refolding chaperone